MKKEVLSFPIDILTLERLLDDYKDYQEENTNEYIVFYAHNKGTTISVFKNKKNRYKVVLSGNNSLEIAKQYVDSDSFLKKPKKETLTNVEWLDESSQIGSDEVGVGDLLLPMIVVASVIKDKDIRRLKELGVKDSKKLSDEQIKIIAPELLKFIKFSKLTLPNTKYNEMYTKNENINSLKAKMHNRALANLYYKFKDIDHVYIDQFVSEKKYFEYLTSEDEPIVKDIVFKTKGETYYPSIAVSSIIARYSLLLEREKLIKKYDMDFPFGANAKVDNFLKEFQKRYGIKELEKLVKKNFSNFTKINDQ